MNYRRNHDGYYAPTAGRRLSILCVRNAAGAGWHRSRNSSRTHSPKNRSPAASAM